MKGYAAALAFWSGLLAVWAAVLAVWYPDSRAWLLLFGAAAVMAAFAVAVQLAPQAAAGRRTVPLLSPPAAVLAWAVAIAVTGFAFGLWLLLIGLGLVALAAGGLVREWRAERQEARA